MNYEVDHSRSHNRTWHIRLEPFDLVAVRLADPTLEIVGIRHAPGQQDLQRIGSELSEMESVITRAADPTQQRLLADLSGEFEQWLADGRPVGWNVSSLPQIKISRSDELPHTGHSSLKIENHGKSHVSAWIQSRGFVPPATGRLTVEAWLRATAVSSPMLVRVSVLGRTRSGERFERSIQVGGLSETGAKLPSDWGRRPVQLFVGDVPSQRMSELFVAIDLIGPGQVWVDDVQVFESTLQPEERIHLRGQLLVAKQRLSEGNAFPAEQLLASPWGRYLATCDARASLDLAGEQPPASADSASSWNQSTPVIQKWRDSWRQRWRR